MYRVGQVVVDLENERLMTVEKIEDFVRPIRCCWFEGNDLWSANFTEEQIRLATDVEIENSSKLWREK